MNRIYFNRNFYKLKKVTGNIDLLLKDYGINNDSYIKIIKRASVDILKNKTKILSFLQEKSTEAFKDFVNSDLIIITLLVNRFKQAKRDIAIVQKNENAKEVAEILENQELPTIKKLIKENKADEIKEIIKILSKIKVEVAIIVKPKRDSERILKIKLLIEILYSIIQYEKQFITTKTIAESINAFEEDYRNYKDLTNVSVLIDFKNFDASRWDKILAANILNIRSLLLSIKSDNIKVEESKLREKPVIMAINTLNNLHDLLSELKKIKDVNIHRKYYKEKIYKIIPPISKNYGDKLNWGAIIDVLKKTKWNDLLEVIPRKIRKKYK